MGDSKRFSAMLFGAAVATGISLVCFKLWLESRGHSMQAPKHREVGDVLHEAYEKMEQLEADLSELSHAQPA